MTQTTPVTPTGDFVFGQTVAADYVPEEGGAWIRTMKSGSNQMRLLPCVGKNAEGDTVYGPDAWVTEREHYEPEIGSYVCINDHGSKDCIGCKSPAERVRKRKRNYYVQAIDKDGELRIFKFGTVVFKVLQQRHQRAVGLKPENTQPLSGRDYFVHKSGSGLKTDYDVESGDPYDAEWPEERLNISEALQEAYQEAMARYRGDKPRMDALPPLSDDEDGESTSGTWNMNQPPESAPDYAQSRPAPAEEAGGREAAEPAQEQSIAEVAQEVTKTRGQIMAEKKAREAAAAQATKAVDGSLPKDPTKEEIEAADTQAIKDWLTAEQIEFPARVQRTKIVAIALEALDLPGF